MEPSWVPAENRQAIDRAHRIGQLSHVVAHYLYLPGTLDERILSVMRRKARDVRELFKPINEIKGEPVDAVESADHD